MNYREKMREYLKEPDIDGSNIGYGKWYALNPEQRQMIRKLLDEMDSFDIAYKKLFLKTEQMKERIDKAIEYILLGKSSTDTFSKREDAIKVIFTKEELDLLEILKGED